MNDLNTLWDKCLLSLNRLSFPTSDAVKEIQRLVEDMEERKWLLTESEVELAGFLISKLVTFNCVKLENENSGSYSKETASLFMNTTITFFSLLTDSSYEAATIILTTSFTHLSECENCNFVLMILNTLCSSSRNVRLAFQTPSTYSHLSNLLTNYCLPSENILDSLYSDISSKKTSPEETKRPSFSDTIMKTQQEDSKGSSKSLARITSKSGSRSMRRQKIGGNISNEGNRINQTNTSIRPSIPRLKINEVMEGSSLISAVQTRSSRRFDVVKSVGNRSGRRSGAFFTEYLQNHSGKSNVK